MNTRPLLLHATCFFALPPLAGAADWPQWRGPDRTDVSRETGLLRSWPAGGPKLLWTYEEAGLGFSGPAIVGNRLYSMGLTDKGQFVFALDTTTGKRVWSTEIGPAYRNDRGDGPRGTPTVDGVLLYGIGANGELFCVETATGKLRWQRQLLEGGGLRDQVMGSRGYSESPLIDGDQLIYTPGGARGTLAALDKRTGQPIWRTKELTDKASYSSVIVIEVAGVRQYAVLTEKGVAGVAAREGRLLWYYRQPDFQTAVVATPIFHNQHVYVTAGYGAGCDLVQLLADGRGTRAEKVYANKNMKNHHGGVVLVGEHLYGYSDGVGWICQEFQTGRIVWEEKQALGKGSLTCADGHLYCYSENNGTAVLIEATPAGWKEKGRFTISTDRQQQNRGGMIWTHPVVANGRLYLRDQNRLFCYDIKDPAAAAR
jgi:outer membrane protein assembly factor BamB